MFFNPTGDTEYWNESDSEIDEDFSQEMSEEPPTPDESYASQAEQLSNDEQSVIWWVIAFSCVFELLPFPNLMSSCGIAIRSQYHSEQK